MIQVYDFTDYKIYLKEALLEKSKTLKGVRSRFADAVGCRSGYVTQIFSGTADLSPEQANQASLFLGHTDDEAEYFLLLVMFGRAGTKSLRESLKKQIHRKSQSHQDLKSRFDVRSISSEHQSLFYSSWHYLAILTALSVPDFRSKELLSQKLGIPLKRVSEILDFLESSGLITLKAGKFVPGTTRTHLGKDSPHISKHHLNWRLQAIQSIENPIESDLHYSSVIGISEKDFQKVKERLIQALDDIATIIEPSPEESVYSLGIDCFSILKGRL